MTRLPSPATAALGRLEAALLLRRFTRLDLRLRIELLGFALLAAGFLGWKVRVPLDGVARAHGAWAAGIRVAAGTALSLIVGGLFAAVHHRGILRRRAGLEWLALPLPPREVARHLERVSSWWALWALVPGAALLVAAIGLIPVPLHVALAIALLLLLLPSGRAGASLAGDLGRRRPGGPSGVAIEGVLRADRAPTRRAVRPPMWARMPAWLALWLKDLVLSTRPGPVRARLLLAALLALLSALAWRVPGDPRLGSFLAFAVALLAAAAFAEWIVQLCGSDPFPVLRGLPLGVGSVWGARFASALLAGLLLTALHVAVLASSLPPPGWTPALRLQIVTTGGSALLISTLGANYGITLFPRADHAMRILGITLGLGIAASLMIPLVGWVTLLTGLIHSARRLPRWGALEES